MTGHRFALALLLPALALLGPLFLFPLAILLRNSFNRDDPNALMVADLTLANYRTVLSDGYYLTTFANTAVVGLGVALATLVIGYPFAWFLTRHAGRSRPWLVWILYLPLIVSVVVRVFGWIVLAADGGLINRTLLAIGVIGAPLRILYDVPGMILGMVHRYLPMMILPIANALAKTHPEVLRASGNLGAGRAATFFRIEVPLSLPGIVSGLQLVFASVLSDFVLPMLMGTTRFRMLAPAIYDEAVGRVAWASAAAMACVALLAVIVVLLGTTWLFRRLAPWTRTL